MRHNLRHIKSRVPKSPLFETVEGKIWFFECHLILKIHYHLLLKITDENQTELGQILADDSASPSDFVAKQEMRSQIQNLLYTLSTQQRDVITLRYGLNDGKTMTYEQIGNHCGISREKVRQIKNKAIKLLQQQAIAQANLAG